MIIFSRIFRIALIVLLHAGYVSAQGYQVGDRATDFKLKNVDGKYVSLADNAQAKGHIVIFTCNHCPFAKKYEERIMALDKTFRPQGYPVVAINPNDPERQPEDSYENMQERARAMKYSFPYLIDETQEVARAYGAEKTPQVYLLQRQGNNLTVRYIGAIDNNVNEPQAATLKYVEQAVADLKAGRRVRTTETRAIGCTVKWKES